jgi:DNA-binding LacI/PurR family transcriptional regulator
MADVARAAGVSVATVSYVVGGRSGNLAAARISSETRLRVLATIQEIGYRVNEPARALRRNRTDRVLLLMDRLSSPFDQLLASEVESRLEPTGRSLSIMVCTSAERLDIALGMARQGHADGAIVQGRSTTAWQDVIDRYAREGIPIVAVSNVLQPRGFDVVANTEEPAIQAAVDHLVRAGHKRIGMLAHAIGPGAIDSRTDTLRHRLRDHGLDLAEDLVMSGARDRNEAFESVRTLLTFADPPTAIFSASDTGGIAAIWAALSLGRRVPDDVAVVGCGNVDEDRITVPRLSSAGPAAPNFGPIAQLLLDRLDTPHHIDDRHLMIPWEFFARESSEPSTSHRGERKEDQVPAQPHTRLQ